MLLDSFVVFLPFLALFGGILVARKTVLWSACLAVAVTGITGIGIWQMTLPAVLAASAKAVLVTLDITLILAGALLLLSVMERSGVLGGLKSMLVASSPDMRIQAVVIGIFFVGFIEGIAGFGTPAMLAAPLLVAVGFPVPTAILLSLFGNAVAVPFGAVGTPFLIGITQGLSGSGAASALQLHDVIRVLIAVSIPLTLAAPLSMSCLLTAASGSGARAGFGIWKHALLAGLCFSVPYGATALLLGPEFPALLGSLAGGAAFLALLRLPALRVRAVWRMPQHAAGRRRVHAHAQQPVSRRASLPYGIAVAALVVSRLPFLPLRHVLQSALGWQIQTVAGVGMQHTISPLYSPGFFLLLGALASLPFFRGDPGQCIDLVRSTLRKIIRPVATLLALVGMAQLLLYSGMNTSGSPSMPVFAASLVHRLPVAWPLLAPFIGLFGALVTGSVTVSNLLFSDFQMQSALLSGYSVPLILALQVLGAAAGNMIALHNIVAVSAAVHMQNSERALLRMLAKPTVLYALMAALVGYAIHVLPMD